MVKYKQTHLVRDTYGIYFKRNPDTVKNGASFFFPSDNQFPKLSFPFSAVAVFINAIAYAFL